MEQAEFVEKMQAEHRISSVTAADDYPVEVRNWGTEFPIYGTKYKVRPLIYQKAVSIVVSVTACSRS